MLELCYTQHATTKVLARVHTSTACMHMSDNLLPLKQHICPALSPAESSRASLLPLSFEMLCAAACSITASISCPAAANNQARAKAPPTRGSFRPPEPQLPDRQGAPRNPVLPHQPCSSLQRRRRRGRAGHPGHARSRTRAAVGPLCRPPPTQLASLLPWPPMNSNERSAPAAGGLRRHCAAALARKGVRRRNGPQQPPTRDAFLNPFC